MPVKSKLINLVSSLNESEKNAVEKHLSKQKVAHLSFLFQSICAQGIKSDEQLKQIFLSKKQAGQLPRRKKELYHEIIQTLERQNGDCQEHIQGHLLITEYFNTYRRFGMKDQAKKVLEKAIDLNQHSCNTGTTFDLLIQLHKTNFNSEYSAQRNKDIIHSMRDKIKEMTNFVDLIECNCAHYEIMLRNIVPKENSEDRATLLDIMNKPIFEGVEPLSKTYNIFLWYNTKALISYSLGDAQASIKVLKDGIKQFLEIPKKNKTAWKGLVQLYWNLIEFYSETGAVKKQIECRNKLDLLLDNNKQQMHLVTYKSGKLRLFTAEVWYCLNNNKWGKGIAFAQRELNKKIYKEFSYSNVGPLYFNLGRMAFGLANYDLALDFFNGAQNAIRARYPVMRYFVLYRTMSILCHIEKKHFQIAFSQIGSLRKYIAYHDFQDQYISDFLNVLRRAISQRGGDKDQEILLKFYNKHKDNPPNSGAFDFYWLESKVTGKSIKEIHGAS